MAAPPDPATPGLLDLLTVAALGEPRSGGEVAAGAAPPRHAPAATATGSRRLWVEVEA